MDTLPKNRTAYSRNLASEAASMADYGARHTMMQAAFMLDVVAERERERYPNRFSSIGPSPGALMAVGKWRLYRARQRCGGLSTSRTKERPR